mgnify:CR=1 FL=1
MNHYTFDRQGNPILQKERKEQNTLYIQYTKNEEDVFCYFYRSIEDGNYSHIQVQLNEHIIQKEEV